MLHKPNTVCKYSKCDKGEDGGQKHFYACTYCTGTQSWRSMACCKEHYDLYIQEVLAERAKGNDVDLYPDRTDMTKEEVKELATQTEEELVAKTKEELADYVDEDGNLNVTEAVDQINEELNGKAKTSTKKK